MDLNDYRNFFVVCSVALSFFAVTPALNLFVSFTIEEPFSELSILDPTHMAKNYPFDVRVNSEESFFVSVSNHMGESIYYMVYVKFRNQTQSFPSDADPSLLAPIYEFRVFLLDGEKWEGIVRLKFLEVLLDSDVVHVRKMLLNNVVLEATSSSTWDSNYRGFYFQLFFELWIYRTSSRRFAYHDRFVGVWLNMTF